MHDVCGSIGPLEDYHFLLSESLVTEYLQYVIRPSVRSPL